MEPLRGVTAPPQAAAPPNVLSGRKMAQHVLQDAAVAVVFELVGGIDAADQRHALEPAVGGDDLGLQL